MSKALELVQQYADASANWHVENLYGTSKSYTEELRKDKAATGVDLFSELRRMADIEHEHRALRVNEQNLREELAALKASLGEPVAWEKYAIKFANGTQLCYGKPENLPKYIGVRPLYALTNKDQS